MKLCELLKVETGLTALIGGGGKTTLMLALSRELREKGTVLICTSTKIRRPEGFPVLEHPAEEDVIRALQTERVLCIGTPVPGGKLSAPEIPFSALTEMADYVIVEADGARGLPAKAHAEWEPVIPENTGKTILVVGADCFGKPIEAVCHRCARFADLAKAEISDPVTPERLAKVIRAEGCGDLIFVNKAESASDYRSARSLAALTPVPVVAGSLWRGEWECLY